MYTRINLEAEKGSFKHAEVCSWSAEAFKKLRRARNIVLDGDGRPGGATATRQAEPSEDGGGIGEIFTPVFLSWKGSPMISVNRCGFLLCYDNSTIL